MISSFVLALISAFKARRELVPAMNKIEGTAVGFTIVLGGRVVTMQMTT